MAIWAFLSRSPGLLNRWHGGPASLGHVPHSNIFSPTDLISNCSIGDLRAHLAGCWFSLPHLPSNWLNILCTELYNCSTTTFFLWATQIALNQPIHGQGYILIFLDQMHRLFTQMHFLFWPLGWGQYVTSIWRIIPRIFQGDCPRVYPFDEVFLRVAFSFFWSDVILFFISVCTIVSALNIPK